MGFFSKLKTLWRGGAPAETAPTPERTEAAPAPAHVERSAPAQAAAGEGWRTDLTLALRQAEPRLSIWLGHVLSGVHEAGPLLRERLLFLFQALDAPQAEAEAFVADFESWLSAMGYSGVDEFRSELQYRLALALDLEDEEDERDRLFLKLSEGLTKTREQITKRIDTLLAGNRAIDESFWEEFEEILIMADVGFEAASRLMDNLRARVRKAGIREADASVTCSKDELADIFKTPKRIQAVNPPEWS
jgi:Signal recognition particle GTPase